MDRSAKESLVTSMNEIFEAQNVVVVAHYKGLTVAEATKLRRKMLESGAGYKVTKNRLTRLALVGTKFEGLKDLFTGPTAIGYSDDPVAAAKTMVNFAKENKNLVILGAGFGDQMLDVDGVKALASLPSLDELRGKIVGLLQAPAQKIAAVTQAPAGQLTRVFSAYGDKGEAA